MTGDHDATTKTAADTRAMDTQARKDQTAGDDAGMIARAYAVGDMESVRKLYDDWAETYDQELGGHGYVTPQRCVDALAAHDPARRGPVADLGCGTGLAALALRDAGYTEIDGYDLSAEMLAKARETGVYRALRQEDILAAGAAGDRVYANVVAAGLFSPGHAPPEGLDAALQLIESGGLFAFSFNDHTLADPAYLARVANLVDGGAAELLVKEHGPHVPGIGLEATVMVLRKR